MRNKIAKTNNDVVIKGLKNELQNLKETINSIRSNAFFYNVLDMLYLGEDVNNVCTPETLENCLTILNNPIGVDKIIYVDFVERFKPKKTEEFSDSLVIQN